MEVKIKEQPVNLNNWHQTPIESCDMTATGLKKIMPGLSYQ